MHSKIDVSFNDFEEVREKTNQNLLNLKIKVSKIVLKMKVINLNLLQEVIDEFFVATVMIVS